MIGPFIFLDIDGVLNNHNKFANGYCGTNYKDIGIINELLDVTKAKIVLSSAWRYLILRGEMTLRGFDQMMSTHGLEPYSIVSHLGHDIIDSTGTTDRGAQIQQWLHGNCGHERVNYIAIDDLDLGYTKRAIPWFKCIGDKGISGSLIQSDFYQISRILKGVI